VSNTGPLRDVDDAISRLPRYTRQAVESARKMDNWAERLCLSHRLLRWLPFRIITREQAQMLRRDTYQVLNHAVTVGVAARVIAHDKGIPDTYNER
jgi:hypothetical protein